MIVPAVLVLRGALIVIVSLLLAINVSLKPIVVAAAPLSATLITSMFLTLPISAELKLWAEPVCVKDSVSVPAPPSTVSVPPDTSKSVSVETVIVSLPAPASMLSRPAPALIISLPPPAEITSSPPLEVIVSIPSPVVKVSLPAPDVIISAPAPEVRVIAAVSAVACVNVKLSLLAAVNAF